jgi:phosphonate transport system ATP-binding protein
MAILEVENLRSKYSASGPEILKGISFEVEDDDFFAIKINLDQVYQPFD